MTLALRSPEIPSVLIPVDNAPIHASLTNDFHQYIKGLRDIEEAEVIKQVEADSILQKYEIVRQCQVIGEMY